MATIKDNLTAAFITINNRLGAINTALASKASASSLKNVAFTGSYTDLTDKPSIPATKADIGLGNVDNTSDANKPVSTAQQTALDAKATTAALTAHSSATNNPHATTKAQVGLGNVDNTSDATKPLSTAATTALAAKADLVGGKVPTSQIPALAITDVFTAASQAAMLALTAERGDVAIRTDTNMTWILSTDDPTVLGNWVQLGSGAASGVSSVNGSTGAIVLDKTSVGLGNIDNTSDANKPVSTAMQTALNAKASNAYVEAQRMFHDVGVWDSTKHVPATIQAALTQTAGVFKATTDGTMGRAVVPIMNNFNGDSRLSFRVKINKAASSGKFTTVGWCKSAVGVVPTGSGSDQTLAIGYKAGSGIQFVQEGVTNNSIYAEANCVDGEYLDISLHNFSSGSKAASTTSQKLGYRIQRGSVVVAQGMIDLWGNSVLNPTQFVISSNAADVEVSNVKLSSHPLGQIDIPSYTQNYYTALSTSETAIIQVPAKPNGRAVFYFHGMGETELTAYGVPAINAMFEALIADGYTVVSQRLQGNFSQLDTCGNSVAQTCIEQMYSILTNYGLHPRVYLFGVSMGGLAAQVMIEKRSIQIAAAYLAQPVCDLTGANTNASAFKATVNTAWNNNDTTLINAWDPLKRSVADFAGVPMYFLASPSDTTVPKTGNTDAMRTRLGTSVPNWLFATTGNHGDASHFRAMDIVQFFKANP